MRYLSNVIKVILIGVLLWATGLFVYAVFSEPILGEAYKGSFEVNDFSEGWTMTEPDEKVTKDVSFPAGSQSAQGQVIKFENTLPDDVGGSPQSR